MPSRQGATPFPSQRGELEQHFAEPPTKRELRRARWFGFTAVVIGLALALAVGILWGMVVH